MECKSCGLSVVIWRLPGPAASEVGTDADELFGCDQGGPIRTLFLDR
jgi:hypothetical protein